ncbi:MAG: hypothetical protein Q4G58_09255 [bacterium]|nr:hypothetical protein [bacterium]
MEHSITVNKLEYQVEKLLGKGKGGYSYLVHDDRGQYVLKQIHHEPCDYYEFGDKMQAEIADYKKLKECGINMPSLLDVDLENERILKTYIEGQTIYEIVEHGEMLSDYIDQIKEMTRKIYPRKINIDYFPTNFVVNNGAIWYIDFECNEYMDEWNFENWGIKYWSKTKEFQDYVKKQRKSSELENK